MTPLPPAPSQSVVTIRRLFFLERASHCLISFAPVRTCMFARVNAYACACLCTELMTCDAPAVLPDLHSDFRVLLLTLEFVTCRTHDPLLAPQYSPFTPDLLFTLSRPIHWNSLVFASSSALFTIFALVSLSFARTQPITRQFFISSFWTKTRCRPALTPVNLSSTFPVYPP